MKPYYHAHESAYQQIKSKGFVGWGNAKTLAELGDEKTNEYLASIISRYFPTPQNSKALDVGCGTGTTAFILAKAGFNVTGVDISETAIQMGQELAKQQNLEIHFQLADILKTEKFPAKFDLIYDSHCLHCIVFEKDRRLVLNNLKNQLSEDGIFILDTMVLPTEKINIAENQDMLRFDENYILWHKTKASDDYGIEVLGGQHWCAQRRIYPSEIIINEVKTAGFKILAEQVDKQPGTPSMLRLVLK